MLEKDRDACSVVLEAGPMQRPVAVAVSVSSWVVPGGKAWVREGKHIHRGADAGERGSVAEEWREGYEAGFSDIWNTGASHEQSTRGEIGDEAVLDLLAQIRDEPESIDERQSSLWFPWCTT